MIARRRVLDELLAGIVQPSPVSAAMHTTDPDLAMEWFEQLWPVGIEGLVIKPAHGSYRPGDKTSWLKYKHHTDTPVIVAGITGALTRPEALIVGRYGSADGTLRVAGRTAKVDPGAAAELARLLTPATGAHPWPDRLPASWIGTLYGSHHPLDYVRIDPSLVIDVEVEAAAHDGRWRHVLRYRRPRTDLTPDQVPLDLNYD